MKNNILKLKIKKQSTQNQVVVELGMEALGRVFFEILSTRVDGAEVNKSGYVAMMLKVANYIERKQNEEAFEMLELLAMLFDDDLKSILDIVLDSPDYGKENFIEGLGNDIAFFYYGSNEYEYMQSRQAKKEHSNSIDRDYENIKSMCEGGELNG